MDIGVLLQSNERCMKIQMKILQAAASLVGVKKAGKAQNIHNENLLTHF
jgi:hypothetical protein